MGNLFSKYYLFIIIYFVIPQWNKQPLHHLLYLKKLNKKILIPTLTFSVPLTTIPIMLQHYILLCSFVVYKRSY